jgi:sulfur carrier protein
MALMVVINGQARDFQELAAGATVLDLLQVLGLKGDRVALELNGEIAARAAWAETALGEGDKVELVHFVGGGAGNSEARF